MPQCRNQNQHGSHEYLPAQKPEGSRDAPAATALPGTAETVPAVVFVFEPRRNAPWFTWINCTMQAAAAGTAAFPALGTCKGWNR